MTDSRTVATMTICGLGLGLVAIFLSSIPMAGLAGGLAGTGMFLAMAGLGAALLRAGLAASLGANRREEEALAAARETERRKLRARRFDVAHGSLAAADMLSGEGDRVAA